MHYPVFIGGCERSGTTLLRVILDSHSNIQCGPESKIIAKTIPSWVNQRRSNTQILRNYYNFSDEKIDELYRNIILTAISGNHSAHKLRIAEKSPQNVFYYHQIRTLFPRSLIVNVIRDGRDVVASLLEMDWTNQQGKPLEFTVDIKAACERWLAATEAAMAFSASANAQPSLQLRYEDLVTSPRQAITMLLNILEEPWENNLLDFHQQTRNLGNESSADSVQNEITAGRIGRWKALTVKDKTFINSYLGSRLHELGYTT